MRCCAHAGTNLNKYEANSRIRESLTIENSTMAQDKVNDSLGPCAFRAVEMRKYRLLLFCSHIFQSICHQVNHMRFIHIHGHPNGCRTMAKQTQETEKESESNSHTHHSPHDHSKGFSAKKCSFLGSLLRVPACHFWLF